MKNEHDSNASLLAGIEAGGTKYVCAIAIDPSDPIDEIRFSTGAPEKTLQQAVEFFQKASETHGPIASLGIGTFGPADINPTSDTYGQILTTPKPGWAGFNLVEFLRERAQIECPLVFETDVNAAAVAEANSGAGKGQDTVAYITVGTGIGAGLWEKGEVLHGRMHSEVGHIVVPDFDKEFGKDTNHCPFHSSCFEGRAAGPAIEKRWGVPGTELPDDHPAWDLEAAYLAAGCITLTASWSPDIILLGGGVPQKPGLIEKVRSEFEKQSGGYWSLPPLESYLQYPALGQRAGIVGALTLAEAMT